MKYLKDNHPEINLTIFTNTNFETELPEEFQYLNQDTITLDSIKKDISFILDESIEISELEDFRLLKISNKGEEFISDLLVISVGLEFEKQ